MERLTWGEFKKQVEDKGVKDTTEIAWIDLSGWDGVTGVYKENPNEDCVSIS